MVGREALGAFVRGLGPHVGSLGPYVGYLGAYVGGLGPLLEPMLAVLGRSWDLCCRSWAALGAYAGGLAAMLEPKWSVLEGSGPKSGSGSAAVRRWARPERPEHPERWDLPDRSEAQSAFFQEIYVYILELAYRFKAI